MWVVIFSLVFEKWFIINKLLKNDNVEGEKNMEKIWIQPTAGRCTYYTHTQEWFLPNKKKGRDCGEIPGYIKNIVVVPMDLRFKEIFCKI